MKNMKKAIAVLLTCILILTVLPALSFAQGEGEAAAAAQSSLGELLGWGEVYDTVVKGIEEGVPEANGRVTIDISQYELSINDLSRFLYAITYHNPQLFYWSGACSYSYSGSTVRSLIIPYSITGDELAQKRENYSRMCDELYALHKDAWTDLETVIFYSDYLAANYEYDVEGLQLEAQYGTSGYAVRDTYNFLDRRTGVCQAYTATFQQIMNHFGIPCTYARSQNINHIWNLVQVDGAWYHLDVTHNDPTYDRPGYARHLCTLTGATTTYQIKSEFAARQNTPTNVNDMTLGLNVTVSTTDHPVRALLLSSETSVVCYKGNFYGILQDDSAETATLSVLDLDNCLASDIMDLSYSWSVPGQAGYYYPGNYSTLAASEHMIFYFDDSAVYGYDPLTDKEFDIETLTDPTVCIYGLQYTNGTLYYFTCDTPNGPTFEKHAVASLPTPTYYTITWVFGSATFTSSVPEGDDPEDYINASLVRENEYGVSYTFTGWTPEVLPATEDATYTATFTENYIYKIGDLDLDSKVTISDVALLLNILAGQATTLEDYRVDVDRNMTCNISDVAKLLDILSTM